MSDTVFPENSPFDHIHPADNPFENIDLPDEKAIYQMLEENRHVFGYGAGSDEEAVEQEALRLAMQTDAELLTGALEEEHNRAQPMPEDSGAPLMFARGNRTLPIKEARENAAYIENRCLRAWWVTGDSAPKDVPVPD